MHCGVIPRVHFLGWGWELNACVPTHRWPWRYPRNLFGVAWYHTVLPLGLKQQPCHSKTLSPCCTFQPRPWMGGFPISSGANLYWTGASSNLLAEGDPTFLSSSLPGAHVRLCTLPSWLCVCRASPILYRVQSCLRLVKHPLLWAHGTDN